MFLASDQLDMFNLRRRLRTNAKPLLHLDCLLWQSLYNVPERSKQIKYEQENRGRIIVTAEP